MTSGPDHIRPSRRRHDAYPISFENTVQNLSLQPCNLDGFIDYLYYVEHNAEHLQFFLWFCDYVDRWSRLPSLQKQASPVWGPAEAAEAAQEDEAGPPPPPPPPPPVQPPPAAYTGRHHRTAGRAATRPHSRTPSASSRFRHHRSYSHSHVPPTTTTTYATTTYTTTSTPSTPTTPRISHSRNRSSETVPYKPRSNSVASIATAASVSTMALSASASANNLSRSPSSASVASSSSVRLAAPVYQTSDSVKLVNVLALLETRHAADTSDTSEAPSSTPHRMLLSPREPPDWCLYYQQALVHQRQRQPGRDEIDRVTALYIRADGARALPDLLAPERAACLRAVHRTTHPSALLPAFLAADAALRAHAFPAFVADWCVGNTAGPRRTFIQALALFTVAAGFAVAALLIIVYDNALLRLVCLVLWWPALAALFASARYRIDLVLYLRGRRLLRPWEADAGSDTGADAEKHRPRGGSTTNNDPRKHTLQALGPRNDPDGEDWAARHKATPLHRRLLAELFCRRRTVPVRDKGVRALQTRAVVKAVISAGLVSAVLVVLVLFIPFK